MCFPSQVGGELQALARGDLRAATETVALGPTESRPSFRARVVRPKDACDLLAKEGGVAPAFDALAQDVWAKRGATLARLVTLVGTRVLPARTAPFLPFFLGGPCSDRSPPVAGLS